MILTKDQINDIQIILAGTDNGVNLYEMGKKKDDEGWRITKDSFYEFGKWKDENYEYHNEIDESTLLQKIKNKDLYAIYEYAEADAPNLTYKEWIHMEKDLGITNMVTLGVKVPAIIFRRFKYFATQESDVSNKLRELILEYLRIKWQEQAEQLIYEETI